MIISVENDFWRFRQTLDELGNKQLPFATSLALNKTARGARDAIAQAIPDIFTKKGPPTPFTRRAIAMKGARKSNLRAEIFVRPIQAKYLGIEETGGSRGASAGEPILTPVNISLNAYGNIPRNTIKKLLAKDPKRYFLARIRGAYGLWERTGPRGGRGGGPRGLKLLIAFRDHATWRPKFQFHDRIERSVTATFLPNLSAGMARAIATAIR